MNTELHVIFGTGPIGKATARELISRGKAVRMVNRSGKTDLGGVTTVKGDAADPKTARELAKGASHVYNCTNPPYTQWVALFPALQAAVLEAAAAANAKLIVMENLYMYGDTDGKPLTEDLPYNAHTRKGEVRAKMAQDLLAAHKAGKVRVTMGRASDFYGAEALASAAGDRLFYAAVQGKTAQILGRADVAHTYSYVQDIGKGLVMLGEREEALGQAWHLPSPPTLTTREFITRIYQTAGHAPKISAMPKPLFKVLKLFVPILRELDEMLYEFEKPFIVDHSKFARAFGDIATPLDESIQTTVEWFKANPQVK